MKNSSKTEQIFIILSSIVISAYFILVCFLAKDIPYFDDYNILLKDTLDLFNSGNIVDKIYILLSGEGEHRLFLSHLIPLLLALLTGKVNILVITFIVFIIALILFLLISKICNKEYRSYFILPASLLLFSGSNLETYIWAMSGTVNIGINLLALFTIYLILGNKNNKSYIFGILILCMTVFSNGNGMAVIPVLLIGLFWQKRKKEAIVLFIISVLLLVGYFYNISLDGSGSSNILESIKNIHLVIISFFLFVGNNLYIPEFKLIAFFVGFCCIIIYLIAFWNKYYKHNICVFAFLTYLYVSAAMVALGRGNPDVVGADRYHVYASLILICTIAIVIYYIYQYNRLKLYYIFLPFLFIYSILSMIYTGNKEFNITKWKEATAYIWNNYKCNIMAFDNNYSLKLLSEIEESKLFIMPIIQESSLSEICIKDDINVNSTLDNMLLNIEKCDTKNDYYIFKGYLSQPIRITSANMWLIGEENHYKISTRFGQRFGITYEDSTPVIGILSCFKKHSIVSDKYKIALEIRDYIKGTNNIVLSDFVLNVE